MPALRDEEDLEERLSRPDERVVDALRPLRGDLVLLGAAGKMGPSLARMARRALDEAGSTASVIAAARFSDPRAREALERAGVKTVACDLLDRAQVDRLPDAGAVLYMIGQKFGTSEDAGSTWAVNTVAPANAAERYRGAPTVVFSTGNVYPLVPVASGGATEETPPGPVGEYAASALGRERVWEFMARRHGTPVCMYRLNYAVEPRYGVLADLALKVRDGAAVDLRMGHANVIWQGDANAAALRCLGLARNPPERLNVTGTRVESVRELAVRLGERLGRAPVLEGREEPTALLSNAAKMARLFGEPSVSTDEALDWVAAWVKSGGRSLGKPSHFETRDGRF